MIKQTNFSIDQLGDATLPNSASKSRYVKFHSDAERILYHHLLADIEKDQESNIAPTGFEIAGPRQKIFFNPIKSHAAVLTCGGLCPGLNAVIRGVVLQLWYFYGCQHITGIRYGYNGLKLNTKDMMTLNPERVRGIHALGGTILGTSRGAPPVEEMVDQLVNMNVDQLFIIGGDGSMRGGNAIWKEVRRRQLNISVIGIPKTIDNDIPYVQRSFGFETAVKEAARVIDAAHVESLGAPCGIGLVKLMGRYSGFIAASAALASGNANFCLVPESMFELDGRGGLFELLSDRLKRRQQAVIVVAEGAGQHFFEGEDIIRDASGNKKPGDIGLLLRDKINQYLASSDLSVTLKYIDPSYIIRSTPPNFSDKLYCDHLARAAVHAAMAGKGGMLIGHWHSHLTHVPMEALENESRQLDLQSDLWFSLLESTRQPYVIGSSVCETTTS